MYRASDATHCCVACDRQPTSGLDSTNAKGVIDALARLARCGRVVILSIHQPRSYIWKQFDSILLLGCGGEVLYTGRRDRCIEFFDAHGLTCPPVRSVCVPPSPALRLSHARVAACDRATTRQTSCWTWW